MIVVDASAALDLLLRTRLAEFVDPYLTDWGSSLHAPELLDAEVLGVLRRRERRGELTANRGEQALDDLRDLPISLYPTRPLLGRAWVLRQAMTAADALYVALAEALGADLLTTDSRLARAIETHSELEALSP